jgi:Uma2 family endonuclease
MDATTEAMTLDEYAALRQGDERHFRELVRGVVVREPRPGETHGRVQVRMAYHLEGWARGHGGARVTSESGYILGDDPATVRGPDLAVVIDPPRSAREPGGWTRGAPDLAVEVLSPSDTSTAIQGKMLDYLGAGASRVWIVDPAARTVTVYRADGSATVLRSQDLLSGEDVLEGFALPLEELFGNLG